MIVKIIAKNIKNSFQNFRKIYLLLIISQVISVVSIFLVYGIFGNYSNQMEELDIDSYSIDADFVDIGETCTIGELKECLPEVMDQVGKKLDFVFIAGSCDGRMLSMHTEYHNGEYLLSKTVLENFNLQDGRCLSDEDEKNANHVIFSGKLEEDQVGDMICIAGTEFEVVGTNAMGLGDYELPYNSCPDEVKLYCVYFNFKELPSKKDYNAIRDAFDGAFGENYYMQEFNMKNEEQIIAYRSQMVLCLAIGMVSALNTCLLYGYIVNQRRKQMAVYGIVGASKGKRLAINEIEVLFVSLVAALIAFLVFRFGLEHIVTGIYESSLELYSTWVYLVVIIIYILCVFVFTMVQLIAMNRDKLADMLRRTYHD